MTYNIFTAIKEAFETSTHNDNKFARLLNRVKWEDTFQADGEYYFVLGNMTFTTPSLDPFNLSWRPSALFTDGSYIEL